MNAENALRRRHFSTGAAPLGAVANALRGDVRTPAVKDNSLTAFVFSIFLTRRSERRVLNLSRLGEEEGFSRPGRLLVIDLRRVDSTQHSEHGCLAISRGILLHFHLHKEINHGQRIRTH